jgi:hypothetical protein
MTTININDNLFNFKTNKPGKKSEKPKQGRADKMRRTDDYWLKTRNSERRKQTKCKYNTTHRREEQPDPRDLWLEDIHFANFLGSKCEEGIPYNNVHINEPVNIIECDTHLKPEPSKNVAEEAAPQEEDGDYINTEDYFRTRQIEREPNSVWNMNWAYEPETQTLFGYSTFKRGLDEDAEEQPKKRAKEQNQEEAIFESMVAYMREQLELAQAMIDAGELFVCDCDHK